LTVAQLERQLAAAGFGFVHEHGRALRLTFEIERPRSLAYRAVFRHLPDPAFAPLRAIFPTLIYILNPA
jgi:hypothetical protein